MAVESQPVGVVRVARQVLSIDSRHTPSSSALVVEPDQ